MHRRFYANCIVQLKITAQSPLLVQGAQAVRGASGFYQARDPADSGRRKFCIPASSLKGVWRSTVEHILRSFDPQLACDPFATGSGPSQFCGKRLENERSARHMYRESCPACRMFGNTVHAGQLLLQDAWAVGQPKSEMEKVGIAIDRFTGGVKQGALYSYTALASGATFTTQVTLQNVEFWQLGLLALVCREMNEGRIRLGSGTRRGLGHVEIAWQQAEFCYPRALYDAATAQAHAGKLVGAQQLASAEEQVPYPAAEPWLLPELEAVASQHWADELWTRFVLDPAAVSRLQVACVEDALAPKLREGREGFAYAAATQEVIHG